jgi:acyl-CoA synthetase (NDP forming)
MSRRVNQLEKLFRPKSVAIVGASSDPSKLNGRPVRYLLEHGFKGEIWPVNPRYEAIGDLACHASARELPGAPDVGLVLVGANRAVEAVRDLAAAGAGHAIVLASGFGESGEEGRARQAALREAAGSMRILGPNTIGLVNLTDGIMLSASGAMESADFTGGRIALVSQSGGILGSLLSRAMARGIGFSKLVATGNEADLEVADFVDELADDTATDVIALYLETIRDVARFRQAATRAIDAGKRIVAYKVGRSESGARAASSHTGALAGAAEVYDAFLEQTGILRAETFADLLDIPAALAGGRRMRGSRVAIVTSTGGAATILADDVGLAGFDVPRPDAETAGKLLELDLPDAALDSNPVDVTLAGVKPDLMRRILRHVVDSPSFDAVITVVGSSSIGQPEVVAGPLRETLEHTDKPLLAYVSPDAPAILSHLNRNGIPAFAAPESFSRILAALQPQASADQPDERFVPDVDCSDIPAGSLNETDAKSLFSRFGIASPASVAVRSPEEAAVVAKRFNGNLAIKILSERITHKTELGGVALGVAPDDAGNCCRAMQERLQTAGHGEDIDGYLIEEMISGGVEMILGFRRDPQLGPCILLGAGGVMTEIYKDIALRLPPFSGSAANRMIASLACSRLLTGFRGRPRADIPALAEAILCFADMAESLGDRLVEAEINPLFVMPTGKGVLAGDAVAILR